MADLTAPGVVDELARRALESASRPVVLIDGRSGSGKTTLARALAPLVDGCQLVELDDVYPGWRGLDAASRAVSETILAPEGPGHRRWDWDADTATDWRALDPLLPIVVEGAGAITPASAALATLRVWVELPDDERFARVLARSDGDAYARTEWWTIWAAQEDDHLRRNHPRSLADVEVIG